MGVLPACFSNGLKADGAESTTFFEFQDLQTRATSLDQRLDVRVRDGHAFEAQVIQERVVLSEQCNPGSGIGTPFLGMRDERKVHHSRLALHRKRPRFRKPFCNVIGFDRVAARDLYLLSCASFRFVKLLAYLRDCIAICWYPYERKNLLPNLHWTC